MPNRYIVIAVNEGNKTALLEALAPGWTPTDIFSVIPGFHGTMNKAQLANLLADARVESVECDAITTIRQGGGAVDNAATCLAAGGLPVAIASAALGLTLLGVM